MAGYNRIVIMGNLTRDPDYKQLEGSGQAVCRLGLATNRQFKNRQSGSLVQEVCYIDIDVWGAQAESCRQYLQKGRSVLIEGRLKFDSWEDNGQKRSKHSIVADRVVFLGGGAAEDDMQKNTQVQGAFHDAEPTSPLEKDILDQINTIKNRNAKKTVVTKKSEAVPTGEIDFKDQPPFEDDLPF